MSIIRGKSAAVSAHDCKALISLVGDMAAVTNVTERRNLFLGGIGRILGTHVNLMCRTEWKGGQYLLADYHLQDDGRMSPEQQKAYFSGGIPIDPLALYMESKPAQHVALRSDGLTDSSWYRSEHYQLCRRELKLDDAIYCKLISANGKVFGLAFVRDEKDGLLGAWHRSMLEIVCQSLAPMLELDRESVRDIRTLLTPQQKAIAQCYMDGMSAKQAARKLNLAESTVRQYTKIMHRRLNVSSRGELLALLFGNQKTE